MSLLAASALSLAALASQSQLSGSDPLSATTVVRAATDICMAYVYEQSPPETHPAFDEIGLVMQPPSDTEIFMQLVERWLYRAYDGALSVDLDDSRCSVRLRDSLPASAVAEALVRAGWREVPPFTEPARSDSEYQISLFERFWIHEGGTGRLRMIGLTDDGVQALSVRGSDRPTAEPD